MMDRKPPCVADWLLRCFGLASHEPLIGDMAEEFHHGRTAGWYWRQALTAICTAIKSAKSLFVPLLIGWSAQLLIVEILVARHLHFGLYGSLLLVLGYAALFAALIEIAVQLELSEWWDILFKSFLACIFASGWIAFIDVLARLVPMRYGLASSSVRDYLWFNLLGLCVAACRVVRSHQRRDPKGGAV